MKFMARSGWRGRFRLVRFVYEIAMQTRVFIEAPVCFEGLLLEVFSTKVKDDGYDAEGCCPEDWWGGRRRTGCLSEFQPCR